MCRGPQWVEEFGIEGFAEHNDIRIIFNRLRALEARMWMVEEKLRTLKKYVYMLIGISLLLNFLLLMKLLA